GRTGRGGRGGGIGVGVGGVGIGFPGGGRRGGGYPGGGNPGGGYPGSGGGRQGRPDGQAQTPPTLTVRWESALPIREAELKARDTGAEGHYAIAVYGVPRRVADNSKTFTAASKHEAVLKRAGKKDMNRS